jgi:hypothetical protein
MRLTIWTAVSLLCFASPSIAADLRVLPQEVQLTGRNATQRVRVFAEEKGKLIADRSDDAKFASSNAKVATVDESGVVQAVGDGAATIIATHDGKQASVQVKVTKSQVPSARSFRNEVIPIMTRIGCNSGACHGALAGKGGLKLSLRGYDPDSDHFVLTRQALGRRIDRQDPAHSLMLLKSTATLQHGGGRKVDLSSPEYETLSQWIAAGAPGPKPDDAVIQRLEVFPPAITVKPEDKTQVIARAWYTDGRAVDVTAWAKFSSTEDLVAGVDEFGAVTVKGHGEATINVLFSNLVATVRITSPFATPPTPPSKGGDSQVSPPSQGGDKGFSPPLEGGAGGGRFIDQLISKKLAELRIPPSTVCSDHEFIRRTFLDAAGILPKPEEVQAFVADKSPDKRAKLIESLLTRPEFVDYWTYKWADLLLVSTRRLPQQGVWAFHQFIRQSVADNKPWDQFTREIVTASGSTLQNGAANYFVLHKDVSELTEATSVTFLGMSIACCRCHNHPMEKWTQDQYWSFANLFSRVGLKNGERGGEVFVQSQPTGDVLHMRRGVPMPPTPLDGKPLPLDSPADRRHYLADWLTSSANPYFARAIVNRVWRNFMGRGLVEAEDDLRQTNPASNEELLAALVKDFVSSPLSPPGGEGARRAFDIKHLIRLIMNSGAYQRSSTPLPANAADDHYYSHYLIRRLPAEVVLDAYSQITGVPTPFNRVNVGSSGGDAETKQYPMGTRALQLPDNLVVSRFLDAFGRPDRQQTCSCERQQDSSVSQALHLNNGQTLNDKLRDKQSVVERWLKENVTDEEAIKRVFLMALSREPKASELEKFKQILAEAAGNKSMTRSEALEDLFWAVLTGREFLFNR